MTQEEFIKNAKNVTGPRKHVFGRGYIVRDYYNYFKRFNKNLTETQFTSALHALFKVYFNNLITGKDAILGGNLGKLELRKRIKKVDIVNGKLKTNLPVNWNETLKLWHSDESCRKRKTLVRCDCENIFRIKYTKSHAEFNNRQFMSFRTSRNLKNALKEAIINNNLDSFSLYES